MYTPPAGTSSPLSEMIITTRPSDGASPPTTPASGPAPDQESIFTVKADPPTFHVTKLPSPSSFLPRLYCVASNGSTHELNLTPAQKEKFEEGVKTLLAHPDIQPAVDGKTIEKIDFNNLYIYLKGEAKPIPFTSDLNPVIAIRQICNEYVDKEGKHGGIAWPTRSRGERTTSTANTPPAYNRPTSHLKNLEFTKEDEASALANWIQDPHHPKDNLTPLKQRQAALVLKEQWIAYLEDQKRKAPDKTAKEQIEKIENKLNEIWDFGLRFEMAHPLLSPAAAEAKEKAALGILSNPERHPVQGGKTALLLHKISPSWGLEEADLQAEKECAKDLARSSFTDHLQYREVSERIDSPMKHDSLQDAFANLAKAVVAAESAVSLAAKEKLIDEALNAPKIQSLFNLAPSRSFRDEMKAQVKGRIEGILETFRNADFRRTPLAGSKAIQQIEDFDRRIETARQTATQGVLEDADRLAAENEKILDRLPAPLTAEQQEKQRQTEEWAQKSRELSEQLTTNAIPKDQIAAAEIQAAAIHRALFQINTFLNR